MKNNSRSKKIRKGDIVVVIAGNCKGQSGTVLSYKDDRVVVQGLNMKKKHVKPSQQNQKGGIVEIEGSMHVSNVCVCDDNGTPLKLKLQRDANGEGQLYYMNGSEKVVYRQIKSPKAG